MVAPSPHLAYRRLAQMSSSKITVKEPTDDVLRARENFYDFCCFMGKKPAKHMLEWHRELITGEDSECLMGIGGPNVDILAPRGSAKSTVLGLFCGVDDWPPRGRQKDAAHSLHRLHGRYQQGQERNDQRHSHLKQIPRSLPDGAALQDPQIR